MAGPSIRCDVCGGDVPLRDVRADGDARVVRCRECGTEATWCPIPTQPKRP